MVAFSVWRSLKGKSDKWLRWVGLALLVSLSSWLAIPGYANEISPTLAARFNQPQFKQALMGALLYLDDTQIRERPGRGDPRFDACSGDGCRREVPGVHDGALPLPLPFVHNRSGEWANVIHIFPAVRAPWQPVGEALVQLQDANLFMAAMTVYPLYLIDESDLPEDQQVVRDMRQQAIAGIRAYRRGDAYSFWPQLSGSSSSATRVGPLNIPMQIGYGQYLSRLIPGMAPRSTNQRYAEWSNDLFNYQLNPYGVDALANIPNDADDTALALTALALDARIDDGEALDTAPLSAMLRWRDVGRSVEDGRDTWKPKDSGGFLTWLKDEDLPRDERFATPESGVIPLGVNNVDCVVNANALAAMGFAGELDHPAVASVSALMARAVEQRAWPECGLYYPQQMIFPYALSRAYRDAEVRNPEMRLAMRRLLFDLLRDQADVARRAPEQRGAFSGGVDATFDLSTALGLTTLLNIGIDLAREAKVEVQYQRAIADAVTYLLKEQRTERIRFADTFHRARAQDRFAGQRLSARTWDSGLFFSASVWSLAQWRSEAYTTSMVVEALVKYALGYDLHDRPWSDLPRLRIRAYAQDAEKAATDFQVGTFSRN